MNNKEKLANDVFAERIISNNSNYIIEIFKATGIRVFGEISINQNSIEAFDKKIRNPNNII